jgi:1-acyl-sn-glycerol-3-phosphate acyltransferase
MHTLLAALVVLTLTLLLGSAVVVLATLRVPDRPGSFYERAPRWWSRAILAVSGVTVRVHDPHGRLASGEPRIFVANHLSWYDVLALATVLPRYKFIGKAELTKVPLFGRAAQAAAMITIDRDNRKQAFESYRTAADQIRAGCSVVVYPEGTRGREYALRPFKKGPFVLAVAAGVPIVPTLVYGQIEVLPRGAFFVKPGVIHVHPLEPVVTAGLDYEDRDALMREVYGRMADALRTLYDVDSPPAAAPAEKDA